MGNKVNRHRGKYVDESVIRARRSSFIITLLSVYSHVRKKTGAYGMEA